MYIVNFLKKVFYNSNLDFLDIGDIVFINRYESLEEKEKIEEGHEVGPAIIIQKNGKKVYTLTCGSKGKKGNPILRQIILQKKYNLSKDTYAYVGNLKLLSNERFLYKVDTLDEKDLNRLFKALYLTKSKYDNNKELQSFDFSFDYSIGDIISINGFKHFITDIDEEFYYTIREYENKKGKSRLRINNEVYAFNFNEFHKVKKNKSVELENITDDDTKDLIINNYKRCKNKREEARKVSRGKLIKLNEDFYYIYGEEKDALLTIKVYLDREKRDKQEIFIKNGKYYTLFEERNIAKTEDFKIIRAASELEMENIKNLRDNMKKAYKPKPKKEVLLKKEFKPRCIIMQFNTLDKYIILKRNKNTIVFAPLDNLEDIRECTFLPRVPFDFDIIGTMSDLEFDINVKSKHRKF